MKLSHADCFILSILSQHSETVGMDDGNNREKVTFKLIELFTTIEANLLNTIWLIYRCTVEVWLDILVQTNSTTVM